MSGSILRLVSALACMAGLFVSAITERPFWLAFFAVMVLVYAIEESA